MRTVGMPIVLGSVFNLAMIGFGLLRFPLIFGQERVFWVVLDVAILGGYALAVIGLIRSADAQRIRALREANWLGLGAGAVMSADITREYFVDAGPAIGFSVGLAALILTLIIFGIAGARTDRRRNSRAGMAGAWTAVACMLVVLSYARQLNYAFMGHLETILVTDPEYLRGNTLVDPPSYTVWNTLSAFASHAIVLPCLGAVAGVVGSTISGWLERMRGTARLTR